jgi:hypothetical protein
LNSLWTVLALFLVLAGVPAALVRAQSPAVQPVPPGTAEIEAKINAAAQAYKAERYGEAERLFGELSVLDPQNALVWHFLGQSLAATGKKEEARAAYEKSLALQPEGTVAERNRQMLARARRTEPKLPLDLAEGTRQILLSSPLFTSLPDTKPLRCVTQERWEHEVGGGSESVSRSVYAPGTGGVMSLSANDTSKDNSVDPARSYTSVMTLGGLIALTSQIERPREDTFRMVTDVLAAEGQLWPLRTGNKFSYQTLTRSGFTSKFPSMAGRVSASCEVQEQIDARALRLPLGTDSYKVRCDSRSNLEHLGSDPAGINKSSRSELRRTLFRLCSKDLGLCPYEWDAAQGDSPPDFSVMNVTQVGTSKRSASQTCEAGAP